MGIYLGTIGSIELTRKSLEGEKESVVNPSDVNDGSDRFSFDFDEGFLITGDLLELSTTDGTNLDFVDATGWENNTVQTSGNWYIYVDQLGGIKLYDSFVNALNGSTTGRVALSPIARDIPIRAGIRDRDSRLLAQVSSYELSTDREAVDVSTLNSDFREQYATLISGSGSLNAHWDYVADQTQEPAHYLLQLVLRTEIGSSFRAKCYLKNRNTTVFNGSFGANQANDSIWWEFDGLVTNSAVSFQPDGIIEARIDFVTTGAVRLKAELAPGDRVLQETGSNILLDQDGSSSLLIESD